MPGTTAARPSGLCASRPPFIRVQSSVGALGPKGRVALRYPGGRLTSGPSHRRRDAAVHLQRHCRQCEVSRPSLLRDGSHTASRLSARDAASTGLGVSGGSRTHTIRRLTWMHWQNNFFPTNTVKANGEKNYVCILLGNLKHLLIHY